jgi:hypothetical protein
MVALKGWGDRPWTAALLVDTKVFIVVEVIFKLDVRLDDKACNFNWIRDSTDLG